MPLSQGIKIAVVALALLVLLQEEFEPALLMLIMGTASLLALLGGRLTLYLGWIPKRERGLSSIFHPDYGTLPYWLPLLLFLLALRLQLEPPPPKPPPYWYQQGATPPRALYATAQIGSVLRPGSYFAQVTPYKPRERYSKGRGKTEKGEEIPVYIRSDSYYLVSGCRLGLWLEKGAQPRPLPSNSFGAYLQQKGVASILYLSSKEHIRWKNCSRKDLSGRLQNWLGYTLHRAGFQREERGIALGLLLGRSGFITGDLKQQAAHLGILHLFAASGLHLGILYLCLFWPLSLRYGRKSPWALWIPLLPCLIYAYLLQFPISLQRAFTFLSLHALQSLLHRKLSIHDLLLNSALVLLLIAPGRFLGVGTLLSFGAVSGILYFYPVLEKHFGLKRQTRGAGLAKRARGGVNLLLKQAMISLSASLFTIPTLLLFFQGHAYGSLIANIIMVPLTTLLMPTLFGSLIAVALTASQLLLPLQAIAKLAALFAWITEQLSRFDLFIPYDSLLAPPLVINMLLLLMLFHLRRIQIKNAFQSAIGRPQQQNSGTLYTCLTAAMVLMILLLGPLGGLIERYRLLF